jgi:methyl-accepting chemotaxis protein
VEAARAGDAGKGFAVVAEEVRNLAQRSAEAAKNTSSLIEESQKNADNGVAVSQEVAGILAQIVDSVGKLSQLIGEVSSASLEQAKGIEQIGTAVSEMDKLTQANAANAEESASASEELSAQARELNDMVNVLVGIVSGKTDGAHTHRASGSAALKRPPAKASHAPVKAPAAKPAKATSKPHNGQDWKAVAANGNSRNGHAVAAAKASHAESVIPLNDDELKDF